MAPDGATTITLRHRVGFFETDGDGHRPSLELPALLRERPGRLARDPRQELPRMDRDGPPLRGDPRRARLSTGPRASTTCSRSRPGSNGSAARRSPWRYAIACRGDAAPVRVAPSTPRSTTRDASGGFRARTASRLGRLALEPGLRRRGRLCRLGATASDRLGLTRSLPAQHAAQIRDPQPELALEPAAVRWIDLEGVALPGPVSAHDVGMDVVQRAARGRRRR